MSTLIPTIPQWIKKLPSNARRLVKAVGPLIISQSEQASAAFAKHQLRLASVEAVKSKLLAETQAICRIREGLLSQLVAADEAQRVDLLAKLRFLEEEGRKAEIYLLAADQMKIEESAESITTGTAMETEINPAWIDRFEELARKKNEPWRTELLAMALAREADRPGCIGPRALWVIGTLEEEIFHSFAVILDLCSNLPGGPMIPNPNDLRQPIPNCPLGDNICLGNLLFQISDLGLVGDMTSSRQIGGGKTFTASYGDTKFLLRAKDKFSVPGVVPTPLGCKIASLYVPKFNKFGKQMFCDWIAGLDSQQVEKQELN